VKEVARQDITSIMIEGGSSINASAISSGIVDKVILFYAPKIIGGLDAIPSVGGNSPSSLSRILRLKDLQVKKMGDDFMFEGYI
jgi:diaminohydroxyphosphoribosylaminopyrimidine deaminase/5-amino-6-(5-phosphoribosylamino)uracil reductase